jgi:hypothetical protein
MDAYSQCLPHNFKADVLQLLKTSFFHSANDLAASAPALREGL